MGKRSDWTGFQPGKSEVIDLTEGKTLVVVLFGTLKIKAVRGRARFDARSLSPVLLPPGQYVFESPRYTGAFIMRGRE
ncbi:MAG: hypothetical protein ACPG4T_03310 [Nannocystaceae bacterium]